MQKTAAVSSSVPPTQPVQPTGLSGLISRVCSAISWRWLAWTPLAIGAGKLLSAPVGYFLFGLSIALEVYLQARKTSPTQRARNEPSAAAGISSVSQASGPEKITTLGSAQTPIKTFADLSAQLQRLPESPVDVLVIHGNKIPIIEDPGIMRLKPKKLILVGIVLIHPPSHTTRLDDEMSSSKEWESSPVRVAPRGIFTLIYYAASVEEALKMKNPPKPGTNDAYRMVIYVRLQD